MMIGVVFYGAFYGFAKVLLLSGFVVPWGDEQKRSLYEWIPRFLIMHYDQ